jgi:hypothetical protein
MERIFYWRDRSGKQHSIPVAPFLSAPVALPCHVVHPTEKMFPDPAFNTRNKFETPYKDLAKHIDFID